MKNLAIAITIATLAIATATAQAKPKQWQYRAMVDEMTRDTIHIAVLESNNSVKLHQTTRAYLGISSMNATENTVIPDDHDIVSITTNGFLCQITIEDECQARMRIGDDLYELSGTVRGQRRDTITFDMPAPQFIKLITQAKGEVLIEVPFYLEGNRIFRFSPASFNAMKHNPRIAAAVEAE